MSLIVMIPHCVSNPTIDDLNAELDDWMVVLRMSRTDADFV